MLVYFHTIEAQCRQYYLPQNGNIRRRHLTALDKAPADCRSPCPRGPPEFAAGMRHPPAKRRQCAALPSPGPRKADSSPVAGDTPPIHCCQFAVRRPPGYQQPTVRNTPASGVPQVVGQRRAVYRLLDDLEPPPARRSGVLTPDVSPGALP